MKRDDRLLIVLIGCLWVFDVVNALLCILLAVERNLDDSCSWIVSWWRSYFQLAVSGNSGYELISWESYRWLAGRFHVSRNVKKDRCLAFQWSTKREHSIDRRLFIVSKPKTGVYDFDASVHCDRYIIPVVVAIDKWITLLIQKLRRITIQSCVRENCRVCENCFIEDAHGFIGAKVDKIAAS